MFASNMIRYSCCFIILLSNFFITAQTPHYRVEDPESKYCFFIDTFGNKLPIPPQLKIKTLEDFYEGLICVNFGNGLEEDKWGCINIHGDTVIKPKYYSPIRFFNGAATPAISTMNNDEGYKEKLINIKGDELIEKIFDGEICSFEKSLWSAGKSGDNWFIFSNTGESKQLSVDIEVADCFSDGWLKCKRTNNYTVYLDSTRWPVLEMPNENYYGDFVNGFAPYSTVKGKFGFINKKGQPVSPCIFEEVLYFSEEMAAVKMYGKWGYIDTKGKIIIKPEYDAVHPFYENIAMVCKDGKCGFIAKNGQVTISINFDEAYSFFPNGLAAVKDANQLWGFINKKGDWVIKPQFLQGAKFDKFGFTTVFYTDKFSYKKGKLETYEKALISCRGKVVWYSGEKLILK